jgi:hypothetical protein
LPVVNYYPYADLLPPPRPHPRVRRTVEGKKVCAFCRREYEQRPHEHPRRECCYEPRCETARELARERSRDRTPRPVLNEPPRPLRSGNT